MKKIGIIMGSDSDLPVVSKAIDTLKEYGVPFEVHVFPEGPHGMALGTEVTGNTPAMINPRVAEWPRLADGWMKNVK